MILDNTRMPHAKLLRPFLQANSHRLELVYLPPYSPALNLMEGVWKWLKETVINNVFFESIPKIVLAVREFFEGVKKRREEAIDYALDYKKLVQLIYLMIVQTSLISNLLSAAAIVLLLIIVTPF